MSDTSSPFAVIRAELDGYDMSKASLMGRQAAGYGFLRAVLASRAGRTIHGFARSERGANGFKALLGQLDPAAPFEWIEPHRLARVADIGTLYLADATIASHARLRQRVGIDAFSLCGVTHTTASPESMDEIAGLLREAVAPWDALICTSKAVLESVQRVHEAEADYLRWRFGAEARISGPQLPVIPLGVHCDDFAFDAAARAGSRAELGVRPDEVVALFMGRLVFHAKAHPFPMFRALQMAAERTGRRIVLLLAGWAPNPSMEDAFRSGASQFAPDVRLIMVDGRDAAARPRVWSAADLFLSLSDNIQETFGLTPIEAMAAGLPVVVSDWDGYRDTVRQEIDGFRVRTWSPMPGAGAALAGAVEAAVVSYDRYCWSAASATVVDLEATAEAVSALIVNPDLRGRMGEAGRIRARELFDWPVVFRQYQALWAELASRRRAAAADPALRARSASAPRASAARLDPFEVFQGYPTDFIGPDTRIRWVAGADAGALRQILSHPLFGGLTVPQELVENLFALAGEGDLAVKDAAAALGANVATACRVAGLLAKIDLVRFV